MWKHENFLSKWRDAVFVHLHLWKIKFFEILTLWLCLQWWPILVFDQKSWVFCHSISDDHSYKAVCLWLPAVINAVTCIYTFSFWSVLLWMWNVLIEYYLATECPKSSQVFCSYYIHMLSLAAGFLFKCVINFFISCGKKLWIFPCTFNTHICSVEFIIFFSWSLLFFVLMRV
jgi:hypothetical protein